MRVKRSIPELRDRLRSLADETSNEELHEIADEMYRNAPVRRASNKSQTITPELAEEIRNFADEFPDLHQRDIAQEFDVNPGRVSDALNRKI